MLISIFDNIYLTIYLKVLQPSFFKIYILSHCIFDCKNNLLFNYQRCQTSTMSSFNMKKTYPLLTNYTGEIKMDANIEICKHYCIVQRLN